MSASAPDDRGCDCEGGAGQPKQDVGAEWVQVHLLKKAPLPLSPRAAATHELTRLATGVAIVCQTTSADPP